MEQNPIAGLEADSPQSIDTIDLRQIISVILKWKWMIVLITAISIMVSGVMSFFILPPVYEAQTHLLVIQGDQKTAARNAPDDLESLIGRISRLPEMTLATYVEQIKNPVLFSNVIAKLGLASQGYTIETMSKMVEAKAIKDTNLIEVKVQNTDPQLAIAIAATLTELLLDSISENSQAQMSKSVSFLQSQADVVSKELETERAKLQELEARPRSILYLEQERATALQELSRYKGSYQEAVISCQQVKAGLEQLQKELNQTGETVQGQPNPVYLSLKEQIAGKKLELAEKEVRANSIAGYIKVLEDQLNSLQVEITEKSAENAVVKRKVDELEKTYNLLVEKITQTQITKSVNLGETSLQVVSPAIVKELPVKPNKKLNIGIAGLLGLFLSLGLAFVLQVFDNKINSREDIEKHLQLPVLGMIPTFSEGAGKKNQPGKVIAHYNQKSPEAEAFKVLRTNLQFLMVDKMFKSILFTSVGPDEGKSTVLANLAATLAQTGRKVLIVDCDLRLPMQYKVFNLSNDMGLTNVLAASFPMEDCIHETEVPGVSILPSGPIPPNPAEILGSNKMKELLHELSARYDFVLVDAPPVLAVTDAVLLSAIVEGVIMVALAGGTMLDKAKEAKGQLLGANARILGLVLNGVERNKKEHYYYYYYSENR